MLTHWQYPAIVMGIVAALIVLEWFLAVRKHSTPATKTKKAKKGTPQFEDKRRMRGMIGVGIGIAAIAWFIQWQSAD
jgi:hypothetical protein